MISLRRLTERWRKARRCARVRAKRLVRNRGRRSWRRGPWNVRKIEELQQVWLRRIAVSQVLVVADKPVLDEPNHRCVIHRRVRNIMPPRERRDDDVGQAESQLRGKSIDGRGVTRICPRVSRRQIAMQRRRPGSRRHTGEVQTRLLGSCIRVHRNLRDVRYGPQRRIGIVV